MPVAVDLSGRLQAEQQIVVVDLCLWHGGTRYSYAVARVGVLDFAVPLHHVGVALEVRHAHAEVVQLIGELGGEAVNECAVRGGQVALCHRLGDHLCHLVARDVAVAAERPVAVALNHAVIGELRYSVVRPVVARHIAERIRRRECRSCRSHDESRRECGHQSFLHRKILLFGSCESAPPVCVSHRGWCP